MFFIAHERRSLTDSVSRSFGIAAGKCDKVFADDEASMDAMGSTVIAILKRLKFVVIIVVVLTPSIVGSGEDRMVLGPRQFEYDKSGQGAVLCVWTIYLSVKS